jgi:hypothetical protein
VDLYDVDMTHIEFTAACGGNTGDAGTGESCVEFAEIPGHPGSLAIRDNKLGLGSPELRFTAEEMHAFATQYFG